MPQSTSTLEPPHIAAAKEKEVFTYLKENDPSKLQRKVVISPSEIHKRIGILGIKPPFQGFLRFLPRDFIVEEISKDQQISTIEPSPLSPEVPEEHASTIYAEMVKIDVSTLDATKDLSHQLAIPAEKIGYAGIKDRRAITSQRISLRNVSLEKATSFHHNQIFLKSITTGKGSVPIGDLHGNRFTIFIRTPGGITHTELANQLEQLAQNGFPNFYGPQRFGNHQLNPLLGRLLTEGNIDEAIRQYLTYTDDHDILIFHLIRKKAAAQYGKWADMKRTFDMFPASFRHQRLLLQSLIENPSATNRALYVIQDQVKLWLYGYNSYLVNRLLSLALTGDHPLPDPLPLPFSNSEVDTMYTSVLQDITIADYQKNLRQFPFLRFKYRTITPWIMPTIHGYKEHPAGVAISFSLPRGVYATTFLLSLFELREGLPLPEWVQKDVVDSKQILGQGSVEQTLHQFSYEEIIPE